MMYPYHMNVWGRQTVNQYASMVVFGSEESKIKPNLATISIGVVTKGEDVALVQKENAIRSTNVIKALNEQGISNQHIQSVRYSVQPEYEFIDGKQQLIGYLARHVFEITVENIEKVGDIFRVAVENGANEEYGVKYTNTNFDMYYKRALQKALNNAKEKAIAMAETLQVTLLKEPAMVEEERQFGQRPIPFETAKLTSDISPPIQSGLISVEAQVKVEFKYM